VISPTATSNVTRLATRSETDQRAQRIADRGDHT